MVPAKKPKLPSFKKRTREGDSEEMQKVREELKQKKKKGSKKKADAEVTSSQEDGNTQEEQPQQDPEVKGKHRSCYVYQNLLVIGANMQLLLSRIGGV